MSTPACPACKAKFSIKQGVCTQCGLPEWQFVGIADPIERGKAIARWKRNNTVATAEFFARSDCQPVAVHDQARQLYIGRVTKSMRKVGDTVKKIAPELREVNAVFRRAMHELEERGADLSEYRKYERAATKAHVRSRVSTSKRRKHGRQHAA